MYQLCLIPFYYPILLDYLRKLYTFWSLIFVDVTIIIRMAVVVKKSETPSETSFCSRTVELKEVTH